MTVSLAQAENDFKNPELSIMLCCPGKESFLAKRFEWKDWKEEPVSLQLKHDNRILNVVLTTREDGLDLHVLGSGSFKLGTHSRGGGFGDYRIKYVPKNKSNKDAMLECLKDN